MRLIDADALLETPIRITGSFTLPGGKTQPFEAISIKAIESAPTIDPVKRGEWIGFSGPDEDSNVDCNCSRCGAGDRHSVGLHVPHCWKCGAKMDAEGGAYE